MIQLQNSTPSALTMKPIELLLSNRTIAKWRKEAIVAASEAVIFDGVVAFRLHSTVFTAVLAYRVHLLF
jgi:hypothetical protein